jgi:putative spermidine/putrescine transport system substrate-binding protein
MHTQPDLGIKNPYALDEKQLNAAVALLKEQRPQISEYWSDYLKEQQAFTSGDTLIGTTWQFIANLVEADKVPVGVLFPSKGSTGWSDTWMVSAQSKNSNCAYAWMDYIAGPSPNAQSAEYFGEAPANAKACDLTTDKSFCATYHAADKAYADKIWYWTTPIKQCLDGRTDATCTDYGQWTQAWTEIKG